MTTIHNQPPSISQQPQSQSHSDIWSRNQNDYCIEPTINEKLDDNNIKLVYTREYPFRPKYNTSLRCHTPVATAARRLDFCNNCGNSGHSYKSCKAPITSFGVVMYRTNPLKHHRREYLMIRRKDTLGFIDFMRGKYNVREQYYITNMIKQMTLKEQYDILKHDFDTLWSRIWGTGKQTQKAMCLAPKFARDEELNARGKYMFLKETGALHTMIHDCMSKCLYWEEPEWGFPKGRRNFHEHDFDCAMREMHEETGFAASDLHNIRNLAPFEEIFTGSNYKSYRHSYYLMYMTYETSFDTHRFDKGEVSAMKWVSFDEAMLLIRPYNVEKKNVLEQIERVLSTYKVFTIGGSGNT